MTSHWQRAPCHQPNRLARTPNNNRSARREQTVLGTFRAKQSKNLGPQPAILGDFLRRAEKEEEEWSGEGGTSPKASEHLRFPRNPESGRDRTRTGTPFTEQGILSPQCLPFHHAAVGAQVKPRIRLNDRVVKFGADRCRFNQLTQADQRQPLPRTR